MTNLRIARAIRTDQGVIIRTEVAGEWICEPGNKQKLEFANRELQSCQQEEPTANWELQTRGTQSNWHAFQNEKGVGK